MKRLLLLGIAAAGVSIVPPLHAANTTANLSVNAAIAAKASLTVGSAAINFADRSPDDYPAVPAAENPVSVTAKAHATTGQAVTLTVLAGGDLTSGGNTIGISNVTWTASGAGFSPGTMSASAAQTVGSWTGSGSRSGTMSFSLTNNWNYAVGNYSATAVFTLSAQ
jgi:hypothetical protein